MSWSRHWSVLKESWKLQRRRDRVAVPREQTEFLPAVMEVLETPPNPLGRAILWCLLAFVAIAVLWASLGHIDIVATAQGKVIPRGRVKVIQAADAGVVREIRVIDGQKVNAGETLIVLDPTVTQADAAQARESAFVAQIDRARAQALVDAAAGKPAVFRAPTGTSEEIIATQRSLVSARVAEHRTAVSALREDQAQRESDLAMVTAEVTKIEQQLPLAEDQLASLEKLNKEGLVPRLKVMEVKERVVGLRQDLVIRREEMAKNRAALAGVRSQIAKLESEFRAQAFDALSEAEANYRLRSEEVRKAEDKASLTVLTSPIDGVVTQLAVHTIGAVVKPADALLAIVPKDEQLLVEAMVLNKDIGFVREGQPAEVKLEAFPFTRYGVINGTIERISRDSIEHEELGLVFPCLVTLSASQIDVGDKLVALEPGFAASAEIKTGERRIIEFLLSPLSRRLQEAGRER
ncbi:MAG TPA: HlyD family type I secretion periplasmic adaptor subunit [Steroidobacter sp.]|uniref:HlyD family type I secretion periplasmic adaptor subunit n=1 Tax=Steroidobacter sp. TaxID=1978227 RepID=UPI002ED978F4